MKINYMDTYIMFVNGPIRIDDTGIEQVPNQWSVYKTQHEKKLKP